MSNELIGVVLEIIACIFLIYVGLSTDTLISKAFVFGGIAGVILGIAILIGIIRSKAD